MVAVFLVHGCVILTLITNAVSTPLDDYVRAPDPHYSFRFVTKYSAPGVTVHVLNMTSQKWLTEKVSNRPVWWHYLCIAVPDKLEYTDTSFLYIDGNDNTDEIPKLTDKFLDIVITLSVTTGTVAAIIKQIPNSPIMFKDDPSGKNRSEDSIVAWTWMKFLDNGSNPEILIRLPMTKAVVRGMDTISSYLQTSAGYKIDKFVISGASKRGWTVWTTAAVDKRVVGLVPIVMDLLNISKNLHHHFRSLGGWTFAFTDYYTLNLTKKLDSPNMARMEAVIDPLTYNQRYNMPKLIISAGGDEFFLPDDSHYYYKQLQSPKYLKIVPNSEHSQIGHIISDVLAVRAFYLNILEKMQFPNITWTRSQTETGGKISVRMSRPPSLVSVYYARTIEDNRRDFRLLVKNPRGGKHPFPHPVIWFRENVRKITNTEYEAEIQKPNKGWVAFFIQMTFDGVKNSTLDFTTEVCFVPDVFPFPDCTGDLCYGNLV